MKSPFPSPDVVKNGGRPFTADAFAAAGGTSPPPRLTLNDTLVDAGALLRLSIPSRPSLLGKWARKGDLGYIYAPRGHGKTWLSMLIGAAISNGQNLGEWQAGEAPRKVIYFDAEMNLPDVQDRARLMQIDSPSFCWLQNELIYEKLKRRINISDPTDQAELAELLENDSVFIIDNLSTAASGMPENDNDAFDLLRNWLLELRSRSITVIIVHHAGRNGEMRGASRREDMAHWVLSLADDTRDGSNEKGFVTVFKKCRNCSAHEAPALRWTIRTHDGRLSLTCGLHNDADAMLALIREGVKSATLLAEELKVTKGCISKWAKKLVEAGLIENANGRYLPKNPPA